MPRKEGPTTIHLVLTASLAAALLFAGAAPTAHAASPDAVVQWNQLLLNLQATPGAQPATTHPTYELAIMHAAIYDAVVSIHHSAPPYPGAHATVSAAAAAVLARLYGNDVAFAETSPALPGVERSFTSFAEAADEAAVSRIYNGNHTRIDEAAGVNLGRDVVDFALGHGLSALTAPGRAVRLTRAESAVIEA